MVRNLAFEIDQLKLGIGNDWQEAVDSVHDPSTGLPSSPSIGQRHIASSTANGWTAGNIYQWDGNSWVEIATELGNQAYNNADGKTYVKNAGSTWAEKTGITDHTALANVGDQNAQTVTNFSKISQAGAVTIESTGNDIDLKPLQSVKLNQKEIRDVATIQNTTGSITFDAPAGSIVFTPPITVGNPTASGHAVNKSTLDLWSEGATAVSSGGSSTTSSTFQDKTTLSFSPNNTGTYLITASGEIATTNDKDGEFQLYDAISTTVLGIVNPKLSYAQQYISFHVEAIVTITGGASKQFKIQWRSPDGVSTAYIRNARITARRLY